MNMRGVDITKSSTRKSSLQWRRKLKGWMGVDETRWLAYVNRIQVSTSLHAPLLPDVMAGDSEEKLELELRESGVSDLGRG